MNAVTRANGRAPDWCAERTRFPFPDPGCVAAGDEYRRLALKCYAAAGMNDREIEERMAVVLEDAA